MTAQLTQFFDLLLDNSEGKFAIAYKTQRGMIHEYYPSIPDLVEAVEGRNSAGKGTYHCCANLSDPTRNQSNVQLVKSLWLDIDCGKGDGYDDIESACRAVLLAKRELGLPVPTLIKSGHGLHVYWHLSKGIPADEWDILAASLKRACLKWGLAADHSRTTDSSSLLRPPGSWNNKGEPVEVIVLKWGNVTSPEELKTILDKYAPAPAPKVEWTLGDAPDYLKGGNGGELYEPIPAPRAEDVARVCRVIDELRSSRGNVEEPLWRAQIGVLKHCEGGDAAIHDWSSGHPGYSQRETQEKIDNWGAGPTRCSTLEGFRPDSCAACPLYQKIPTPLQAVKPPAAKEVVPTSQGDVQLPVELQTKYMIGVHNGRYGLHIKYKDKELNEYSWKLITPGAFIMNELSRTNGMSNYHIKTIPEKGVYDTGREVVWTAEEVYSPQSGGKFAAIDIPVGQNMKMVRDYLEDWKQHLMRQRAARNCYDRFGWHGDSFVYGGLEIDSGKVTNSLVTEPLKGRSKHMKPSERPGAFDIWRDHVDRMYNVDGRERMQMTILASMAAPLIKLADEPNSIMINAFSAGSGTGKTSTAKVALSVWSEYDGLRMTIPTYNAVVAGLVQVSNLPLYNDEITTMTPEERANLVYTITNNRGKDRADKTGDLRDNETEWRTVFLSSSNNRFIESVLSKQGDAGGPAARILELEYDQFIEANEDDALLEIEQCHGVVGLKLLEYITRNKVGVTKLVKKWRKRIDTALTNQHHSPEMVKMQRMWRSTFSCILAANEIATDLNITFFDSDQLIKTMVHVTEENLDMAAGDRHTPTAKLTELVQEAMPHLLRVGSEASKGQLHVADAPEPKDIWGRYNRAENTVWLTDVAVRKWCNKRGIDAQTFKREVTKEKLIKKVTHQIDPYMDVADHMNKGKCYVWKVQPVGVAQLSVVPPLTQTKKSTKLKST